jgi:hypothetical protein
MNDKRPDIISGPTIIPCYRCRNYFSPKDLFDTNKFGIKICQSCIDEITKEAESELN